MNIKKYFIYYTAGGILGYSIQYFLGISTFKHCILMFMLQIIIFDMVYLAMKWAKQNAKSS